MLMVRGASGQLNGKEIDNCYHTTYVLGHAPKVFVNKCATQVLFTGKSFFLDISLSLYIYIFLR